MKNFLKTIHISRKHQFIHFIIWFIQTSKYVFIGLMSLITAIVYWNHECLNSDIIRLDHWLLTSAVVSVPSISINIPLHFYSLKFWKFLMHIVTTSVHYLWILTWTIIGGISLAKHVECKSETIWFITLAILIIKVIDIVFYEFYLGYLIYLSCFIHLRKRRISKVSHNNRPIELQEVVENN